MCEVKCILTHIKCTKYHWKKSVSIQKCTYIYTCTHAHTYRGNIYKNKKNKQKKQIRGKRKEKNIGKKSIQYSRKYVYMSMYMCVHTHAHTEYIVTYAHTKNIYTDNRSSQKTLIGHSQAQNNISNQSLL